MSVDNKLVRLKDEISDKLQELENELKRDQQKREAWLKNKNMRIKFPRGYVRKVREFEERFPYISDDNLRKNIAYTLQLTEIIRWIFNRFDIDLTLYDMLNKFGIIVIASIVEGMMYGFIVWYFKFKNIKDSYPRKFSKMIDYLKSTAKIIDEELYKDLQWLKRTRNNIHLWNPGAPEYGKYSLKEYNKAVITMKKLSATLKEYYLEKVSKEYNDIIPW